jgi:phosphoenolpyruvate synthase/pyruvate phosphate dikinase
VPKNTWFVVQYEDGAESSFAGQLSSFISSSQKEDMYTHIYSCWKSYDNENVKTYQDKTGKTIEWNGGSGSNFNRT